MAVHQLARPTDIGELFGQGLGTGLGKIVDAKATQKGLEAIGYSRDEAKNIAFSHHPTLIKEAIKSKFGSSEAKQQNSYLQETIGNIERGYAANPEQNQKQQINPQQQNAPEKALRPQQNAAVEALNNLQKSPFEHLINPQTNQYDNAKGALKQLQNSPYEELTQRLSNQAQNAAQPQQRQQIAPQEPKPFTAADVDWARLSPEEALVIRNALNQKQKQQTEENKIARKERIEAFKLTKEERKEIVNGKRSADEQLRTLDEMEKLEGKLDTPGYVEFLKRSGLDIPALMNPESEAYQKYVQGFLRGAKDVFGARVTDNEINQFLKMVPSLSQSAEGRKRIVADMRYLNRAKQERYQAMQEVIKANKGTPPEDLLEQIENRIGKRLDKVAEQFRKDLERPVPKGQNKYITALQATLGTVAGRIPRAAAGAVTGAALGSKVFPGLGTLGGAAIGGLAGLSGGSLRDLI